MMLQKERLLSLLDFAQQSAKLQFRPVSTVGQHNLFSLYEDQIRGLPGVRLNIGGDQDEYEVWLSIERLHEIGPPEVQSTILRPWIAVGKNPTEEPVLREAVDSASLQPALGGGLFSALRQSGNHDREDLLALSDYENASQVRSDFSAYLEFEWRQWAEDETLRRRTINLYSRLFTLKQTLEGAIAEAQIELVWGVGLGIWRTDFGSVSYPLISQLVEMSLNPETGALEVQPRDVESRLETEWYAANDNPGVPALEQAAKEFFRDATVTFSPFDRGTFESLLRTASTNLDGNGIYWPDIVPAENRELPDADSKLKVTDTWVLFARPRTNNLFLQDLEKLRERAEEADSYPPAVSAIVTDPETNNPVIELPSFRGVSAAYFSDTPSSNVKAQDLFFPKPFNDEQVRIIQLLEVSDGVVVQGPPGTGKTHTIANVICHYLAQGKRVLVTSMKDAPLAVLQEQLPDEIRPLAISLLTTERDGIKQFEHAIQKIASEVQSLDRFSFSHTIRNLEASIDTLHGRLSMVDRRIRDWARLNLAMISLDGEQIDPQDAALEVVKNRGQFEWITDPIGIKLEFHPQFDDQDVIHLREARRLLGRDIDYIDALLPQLAEFADTNTLIEVHQDLSQFESLERAVESGIVPALADSSQETIASAVRLLAEVEDVQRLRGGIERSNQPSLTSLWHNLRNDDSDRSWQMLEDLGAELEKACEKRRAFIERPVATPPDIEVNTEFVNAVANLAEGRRPFGLVGLFAKSEQKKLLDQVRVVGTPPASPDDWRHVGEYLSLLSSLRAHGVRWNALARELNLELVAEDCSDGGLAAAEHYESYLRVKSLVCAERSVGQTALALFPNWPSASDSGRSAELICELEKALKHHLSKRRLAKVWATKERLQSVLSGRSGRVVDDLRTFLANILGNPDISNAEMQARWSELMAELSRVLGLGSYLAVVTSVCGKIEASGAPHYAASLKQPIAGSVDYLLPDSWRKAWRLARLGNYLDSVDARNELASLSKEREEVTNPLAQAYRDLVVKRTWLKLAENASPKIRAALQAYLNAILRIGHGTGRRAVRYRADARLAAVEANPAVPCWIMPHYRVSESLPVELGCFDLVVIDEASQSDLTALPSLLRAQKVLVVGDDKQVSPEGIGMQEEKVRSLLSRFLASQVETYRSQMSPERSIYDLFKVVFASSMVMLREHFRCVGPIIEFSKREVYNHELRPLRIPKASERLDPPLVDVLVEDGYRQGDLNLPEAQFIVDEIKAITADPRMKERSIGVVSLLADKQALNIWQRLTTELGTELILRHNIACGDARTFQGKERDIMFLSMVTAPNEIGAPLSRDTFSQRFNVAASRARDRMYLVRSVEPVHLSEADQWRRKLIAHFTTPFGQDENFVKDMRALCESDFEREVYDELTMHGYRVTPQVRVGHYRIDMVVEGHNDARLAVECDGDKYHGIDKWLEDLQRQRILERAGWVFWRCFASTFVRRRKEMVNNLLAALAERNIEPIGSETAPPSLHVERRKVRSTLQVTDPESPAV